MCGRATLTVSDLRAVAEMLEASVSPAHAALYRPRYNAAPGDQHWIVQLTPQGRLLVPAVWGLANGAINLRGEKGLRGRRAVIMPADGFYEWTGPRNGRRPIWFRPRGGGLLFLAALMDTLPDGRLCFAVLTTDAAGEVAKIHDRMPVVLPREKAQQWLERPDSSLLVPWDSLTGTEVSPRVNDVKNDDPSLLAPPGQLSLL